MAPLLLTGDSVAKLLARLLAELSCEDRVCVRVDSCRAPRCSVSRELNSCCSPTSSSLLLLWLRVAPRTWGDGVVVVVVVGEKTRGQGRRVRGVGCLTVKQRTVPDCRVHQHMQVRQGECAQLRHTTAPRDLMST